jgi:hypothetical protein
MRAQGAIPALRSDDRWRIPRRHRCLPPPEIRDREEGQRADDQDLQDADPATKPAKEHAPNEPTQEQTAEAAHEPAQPA